MMSVYRTVLPWVLFAAALLVAPKVFTSGTSLTVLSVMGIMIVFALSYNILLGQTGLLSFGHAVYYGLAGFVAIHAMNYVIRNKLAIPLPAIPLVGGLAGLAFGILFGWLSTRRAGTVFSMISLGLGELVASSALILRTFFGGEEGITANRAKLAPFFGSKFGPQIEVYYLIAGWCLICVIAMYALTRTPFGRMSNAVRENPERAEFVGYSTQTVRFLAFCFAAFFAGVAGSLAALNFEIMNSQSVGAQQSGLVLLMTYFGGVGSFIGPIIGAIIITLLQVTLSDVTGAWLLYFGLLFILVVLYSPGGVAGWLALHVPVVKAGLVGKLVPSYTLAAGALTLSFAGAVSIIELAHHHLVKAQGEGTVFHRLSMTIDSASPLPWIVGLILFVAGLVALKLVWPRVHDAWGDVAGAMKAKVQA